MLTKCFERFLASNTKETGLNGYIYDFSVDYVSIDVDNIKGIHKYLIKKKKKKNIV